MNKDKIILDLCGGTGSWSKPYKDAAYIVHVITLPTHDLANYCFYKDKLIFIGDKKNSSISVDVKDIYGIFCAPPCTMFSRARTTAKTPRDFKSATGVVKNCLDIIWGIQYRSQYSLKFWAMENPAGHLQRFMGKPPFSFHPYDFGDRHSKKTFIWGNFNLPKTKPIKLNAAELLMSKNNTRKLPDIPTDYVRDVKMKSVQIRRSITPQGFVQAFYKANK